jgi:hypothetical protein
MRPSGSILTRTPSIASVNGRPFLRCTDIADKLPELSCAFNIYLRYICCRLIENLREGREQRNREKLDATTGTACAPGRIGQTTRARDPNDQSPQGLALEGE